MQNKTDKGTSLVSKSLPVVNSNSVYRLLSARKKKYYDSTNERYDETLKVSDYEALYNFDFQHCGSIVFNVLFIVLP